MDDWGLLADEMLNDDGLAAVDELVESQPTDSEQQDDFTLAEHKDSPDFTDDLKIDYKMCPQCQIECLVEGTMLYCSTCGYEVNMYVDDGNYSISYSTAYNTSSNSFIAFKIVGKDSGPFNRSYLRMCADYSKYSHNNTLRELQNLVYRYKGNKIPKNIVVMAANIYNKIRSHGRVFRGDSKKGVMVACIYYACRVHKITKTPRYLCNLTNVPDKYLSQGERILHDLIERGVIQIPKLDDPKLDYLSQYFEALKIPEHYMDFAINLIYRAEATALHMIRDCRDTTKCAGTVYMLCKRIPELRGITRAQIEENCDVSRTTFIRYYTLLCSNYQRIKKVFIRHHIPMPVEWRESTADVKKRRAHGKKKQSTSTTRKRGKCAVSVRHTEQSTSS